MVTSFKPTEDAGAGFVIRLWELGSQPRSFDLDVAAMGADAAWHTNLVETDLAPAVITNGVISATATANEITTYRFTTGPVADEIFADGFESGDLSAWSLAVQSAVVRCLVRLR